MAKKLKSVELFLDLSLTTAINVTATQAEEVDKDDNLSNPLLFNKKTL